jgi:predicted permease
MFVLVMLLQNAVPTALNAHTLATLHGNREAEMGSLLFWEYLASIITVPAWLCLFLHLTETVFRV